MTRVAALTIVLGVGALVAGWPVTSHAQPDDREAQQAPPQPVTPIPPISDGDREAAFPEVEPHAVQDQGLNYFVLFDQVEVQGGESEKGLNWDSRGWFGRDLNRVWFRTEGEFDDGRSNEAAVHLFYGRAFARWWDLVVGLRQDFLPGPAQSWLAVGVQGMAPYWFDVEATAYLGAGGQTAARLTAEYELLFTNRLALQPLVEVNLYGKTNAARRIGAGVSAFDAGLRLRYELRREFAPYLGVTWHTSFGETAGFAEAAGGSARGRRIVAGLRFWF